LKTGLGRLELLSVLGRGCREVGDWGSLEAINKEFLGTGDWRGGGCVTERLGVFEFRVLSAVERVSLGAGDRRCLEAGGLRELLGLTRE